MKQGFTYYLTLLVIKFKGLKKSFSQEPIDFQKIRKEDIFLPKGIFFKKHIQRQFQVLKTSITAIGKGNGSDKLIIFIHGGAFISGPAQHHWDTIKSITKKTEYTIWMCNYPKAPEHQINEISENIDAIYTKATENFETENIILLGDSVGGTLITTLAQRLIQEEWPLPKKLVLISPVMDSSFSNPDIDKLDSIDPMLSKKGLLSAKKMCAMNNDLKNPIISPLYGSFEGLPETVLYAGDRDITYPDQILVYRKAKQANVDIKLIEGKNMPHIWPFLPIMREAKEALDGLIKTLNQS
ncbi:alpha/beta hydrolase [Croceitalea sp. MTPC9]|uniref:alpha/beta hydrolase n=1 Tax=unclassified Croceitalea TaxID=2632280 RepID=UPI002B3B4A3D|nr:alpha/beta hydrolase [Croceitalea sp. MTPC6]GMN16083.1 alpha/beta hydrolase [Croceitalea sp. MTPC9]